MEKNNIKVASLKKSQIESELKRVNYYLNYKKIIISTICILLIIFSISIIISNTFIPVFQINSNAMSPLYDNGDIVASIKYTKIDSGDVIAFYHGNKILIKRVIATQGQWVNIDDKGIVSVDGNVLEEKYVTNLFQGDYSIDFPYQVPNESYFVLSDDRENIIDSRNSDIGSINKKDIIGRILFKVWPLK